MFDYNFIREMEIFDSLDQELKEKIRNSPQGLYLQQYTSVEQIRNAIKNVYSVEKPIEPIRPIKRRRF